MFLMASTNKIINSIIIMGKGMLAIFAVMLAIYLFIKLLNLIDKNEDKIKEFFSFKKSNKTKNKIEKK